MNEAWNAVMAVVHAFDGSIFSFASERKAVDSTAVTAVTAAVRDAHVSVVDCAMAAKKKPTKKQAKSKPTKSKKTAAKKGSRAKKAAKKTPPVRKVVQKRGAAKALGTKKTVATRLIVPKKQVGERTRMSSRASSREEPGADSGGQSGDLQGLSRDEGADSESVRELLDEGNAFEAGVVTGVEDAGNADEREVQTHEVPEDDVPDEYLDRE